MFAETHYAEQSMKIRALLVIVRSVRQGSLDLTGGGRTSFAAFTALALQFGMAAQSHPLEMVW